MIRVYLEDYFSDKVVTPKQAIRAIAELEIWIASRQAVTHYGITRLHQELPACLYFHSHEDAIAFILTFGIERYLTE